ncbi:MAG: hypothetical protein WD096_08830 [Actinomycetota bacterium]
MILAVRFKEPALEAACALLAVVGVTTFVLLLRTASKISPDPHQVETVADRGPEVAGYVATYLLPFVTVPEPSGRDLMAYALFVLVLGVVYVHSDMLQINPVAYFLRYRIFAVTTTDGWEGFLLSRVKPAVGRSLLASRIQNTLAIARTTENRHGHSVAT